jgi:hypothetical protein
MDKEIVRKLNNCLHSLNNMVTEQSANYQINDLVSDLLSRYDIDKEDRKNLMALDNVTDYNFRKKVLLDTVDKYVR